MDKQYSETQTRMKKMLSMKERRFKSEQKKSKIEEF